MPESVPARPTTRARLDRFALVLALVSLATGLSGRAVAQSSLVWDGGSAVDRRELLDDPPEPPPIELARYSLAALQEENGEAETTSDDSKKEEPSDADEPTADQADKDDRLGEAPEDTSQLFLRQATVLLEPGEKQFDHGLVYSVVETESPIFLSDGTLSTERLLSRQWIVPLGLRFGMTEKVQGFVDVPFGYSHVVLADREQDDFASVFGIGDVGAGLTVLLRREKDQCPDVIGTISVGAPTGDNPFGIGANDPALGSGFWRISANVSAVKSYDPVVLFGSVGYSHFFNRSFLQRDIQLGESVFYSFGMGMAVNDDITLSTSLSGSYQSETRLDGLRVPGTFSEPISLRMALTNSSFKCHIVEPFVRFGLTDSAADASFGVNITRL